MPETANTTYEHQARKAFEQDPHYLATVARMGRAKRVVSEEEIFSAQGVKLLDKGVVIDAQLGEWLLSHKLMKPVDQSLAVMGGVAGETLAAHASELLETQSYLRRLFPFAADRQRAAAALAALQLPAPMRFKLTVAREQRPQLFEHLLTVALICRYAALQMELPAEENDDLLLAGLLHDLGELHTDPALLEPGRRLDRDEMGYIYAHPITGFLIAKVLAPERPAAALAVLEHQERLDGSGYPYGRRAATTSRLGRMLGIVDVCAAILARFGNSGRLSALMRLNRSKYDPELLALLQKGFGGEHDGDEGGGDIVLPELKAVAKLFRQWNDFSATLADGRRGPPPPLEFLFERMVNLQVMLLQFGFDPHSFQLLRDVLAEDSRIAGELAAPLNEVRWQFGDLEREIVRRQEAATKALPADKRELLEDWLADLREYLEHAVPATAAGDAFFGRKAAN